MSHDAVESTEDGSSLILSYLVRVERDFLALFESRLSIQGYVGRRHLYVLGAARRALAQSRAFRQCVTDGNHLVAIALVRLQLDTVLRLHALYWVDDAEAFATVVFSGKQIDRIAAADGSLMKDRYLIDRIKTKNPWVEEVYKNTSGLIHFSERHMHAAIRLPDDASGEVEFFLGATDPQYKLADYKEIIGAFFHCTSMILHVTDEWLVLPPLDDESEKQNHPFLATRGGNKVTP